MLASQTTVLERANETARDRPIGHGPSLTIAESAVERVKRKRKQSRANGKAKDVAPMALLAGRVFKLTILRFF